MAKIRFGVIGSARIAVNTVIPALQISKYCEVTALASRQLEKAREAAEKLHIPKSYGSYEELLADPEIDAVYIPLPNHLHVPWTIKAMKAGKHVLCEKPLALSVAEAHALLEEKNKYSELKVMEAFMYRFHPQWQKTLQMIQNDKIGTLRTIVSFFSYYNTSPDDYRNNPEYGGGGMMDIGCYNISLSRFLFKEEPIQISGSVEYDEAFGIDKMASGILTFEKGTSVFTCGTQLQPYQRVDVLGTKGMIALEMPFNPPPEKESILWYHQGTTSEKLIIQPANQYTLEGDAFARSILDDTPVPTPLEDAVANMEVIEAVLNSARTIK